MESLRIAVVDDDAVERRLCLEKLQRMGYVVETFCSGEKLLDAIAPDKYDIVLLDYYMPGGMNGYMTFERLKEYDFDAPVLMVTSFGSIELVYAFMKAGGAGYVPKPITDWEYLDREIKKSVKSFRDCKLLKALEEKNKELEIKQKTTDVFLDMLAHELRKPISVILGNIECIMMDEELEVSAEVMKQLEYAQIYSKRLSGFLNSLLIVCGKNFKVLQPHPQSINTKQLLGSAVEDLSYNFIRGMASLQLEVFTDCNVLVDTNGFSQILLNLIDNAIKYSKQYPEIKIVCRENHRVSDFIEILVIDNGIGMDEKDLSVIFENGKRLEDLSDVAGNGLGLFLAKRMIEKMGGQIWATSQKGIGSTFGLLVQKEKLP